MPPQTLTRRAVLGTLGGGLATLGLPFQTFVNPVEQAREPQEPQDATVDPWTPAYDAALLQAIATSMGKSYDPALQLLSAYHGAEYSYQSNVRNRTVHPTRNSLEYASVLLYFGDSASSERALAIIRRILANQIMDPTSKYFGLWGWYYEEPPAQMHAADFNWADFNGATLLNILLEHEARLPAELARQCRQSLSACALSIRKRNVGLDYTNIAFMGTYVTLVTAELLQDAPLLAYAQDRTMRLEATVAVSGSFAEYNSPGYMAVTLGNLARILHYAQDPAARAAAARLNSLGWKHVATHWHQPTLQLAGPMSRAYDNDIGSPMWIQKATGNRVRFVALKDFSASTVGGEVSIPTVPWHCPEDLIPLFTDTTRRQHREIFIAGKSAQGAPLTAVGESKPEGAILPVEGTTLLTPAYSLGTVNRSDCWVQRRNLLAYWGGPSRPPRTAQLRVLHDDYEFTSAQFYAAQLQGAVLGAIRFRLDGGDKHPSLDSVKDRTIVASRMRVQLVFGAWNPESLILIDGKRARQRDFSAPAHARIAMQLSSADGANVKLAFQARAAGFLAPARSLRFESSGTVATLSVELFESPTPRPIRLATLVAPGCDFTLLMDDSTATLQALDATFAATAYTAADRPDLRTTTWNSPAGALSLTTAIKPQPIAALDRALDLGLDGKAYPFKRL